MDIERTIDLKDLLKRLLLKWRMILLWMLIGAVALGGVGVLRRYAASASAVNAVEEAEDLEELSSTQREELSAMEAEEVDWAVSAYETYTQKYEELLSYVESSVYMNIDPYHVSTMQLDYYIRFDSVQEDASELDNRARQNDVRLAFASRLQDDSLYTELTEGEDAELAGSNIVELLSFDSASGDLGSNNLSISVIADTREHAELIAGYVQAAVEEITPQLQEIYGDFTLMLYNDTYVEKADTTLVTTQQTQYNTLITLRNSLTTLKNGFTDDQKTYFETRVSALSEELYLTEESEAEESDEDGATFSLKEAISLKYILLGAIVGALCVIIWYAVLYLFNGKLHVSSEMEQYYEVSVLGSWKRERSGRRFLSCIDRLIYALFGDSSKPDNERTMQLVDERVRLLAEKNDWKSIYVSGAYQDETTAQIAERIRSMLKNDLEVAGPGSAHRDPDALKRMAQTDAVLLVETVACSSYDDIQEEVAQCKAAEVPVIGCVVLE